MLRVDVHLRGLMTAGAVMIGVPTLAGFLGRLAWWLEVASHFRVQYLFCLLAASLALLWLRARPQALVCALLAGLNLLTIAPIYLPNPDPGGTGVEQTPLRVLLINVNSANRNHDAVLELIRNEAPDFAVILEVNARWERVLSSLEADYPYKIVKAREDNFGFLLIGRMPMKRGEIMTSSETGIPTLVAKYDLGTASLTLLAAHPLPPAGPDYSRRRNAYLLELADTVRNISGPVLLLGDLNMTPWSPYFGELLENSGLLNASKGKGIQATWPSGFWPLRIPIDHALHSSDIRILGKRVGNPVGSDHLPVIVDLSVVR